MTGESQDKNTRKQMERKEKPFLAQQQDPQNPLLFHDVPTPAEVGSALEAWEFIQNQESLQAGAYRVVQVCGVKTKKVVPQPVIAKMV